MPKLQMMEEFNKYHVHTLYIYKHICTESECCSSELIWHRWYVCQRCASMRADLSLGSGAGQLGKKQQ